MTPYEEPSLEEIEALARELAAQSSGDVVVSTYPWILPHVPGEWDDLGKLHAVSSGAGGRALAPEQAAGANAVIRSSVQQAQAAGARVALNDNATTDAAGNHTGTFAGHERCTTNPYFNNVNAWPVGTDYSKTQWALHPTLQGQQQWARDIP